MGDQTERHARQTTDWSQYYQHRFPFSRFTHIITRRLLTRILGQCSLPNTGVFVELGGANSTFYSAWRRQLPGWQLFLIDKVGSIEEAFLDATGRDDRTTLLNADVLVEPPQALVESADCVVSVGLVEHFVPGDTARAIDYHFALAKPGGIVIITFPTPTFLYRWLRATLEAFNFWPFPDERPLAFSEVVERMQRHGCIITRKLNWKIGATQGVLVSRKH